MRLAEVVTQSVVRNTANGSYYRHERQEGTRVRIRPLELFPNGLLIAKPTDTIVEPDLDVDQLGPWSEEFTVTAPISRKRFERELERKREQLAELLEMAKVIAPKGRGSHANRVKAVQLRIDTLERGLSQRVRSADVQQTYTEINHPEFLANEVVQLPSGKPALVLALQHVDGEAFARIRCRAGEGMLVTAINLACLRPWNAAFRSTV